MDDLFDFGRPKYKIAKGKNIRLIELFAGIGAQASALERMGVPFEHHYVCEFDKFAIQTYNAIHGTAFPPKDICEVRGVDLDISETDRNEYIMVYSFPCQALSVAGKGMGADEGSGTTSSLLWEVKRLLEECDGLRKGCPDYYGLPQILLMENVPALLSQKHSHNFQEWLVFLEGLGYRSYTQVLNATDYGVAQNRERVFCLSILDRESTYEFPSPVPLDCCVKDYLDLYVDDKYYINEKTEKRLVDNLIERGEIADYDGTYRVKNGESEDEDEEQQEMFGSF